MMLFPLWLTVVSIATISTALSAPMNSKVTTAAVVYGDSSAFTSGKTALSDDMSGSNAANVRLLMTMTDRAAKSYEDNDSDRDISSTTGWSAKDGNFVSKDYTETSTGHIYDDNQSGNDGYRNIDVNANYNDDGFDDNEGESSDYGKDEYHLNDMQGLTLDEVDDLVAEDDIDIDGDIDFNGDIHGDIEDDDEDSNDDEAESTFDGHTGIENNSEDADGNGNLDEKISDNDDGDKSAVGNDNDNGDDDDELECRLPADGVPRDFVHPAAATSIEEAYVLQYALIYVDGHTVCRLPVPVPLVLLLLNDERRAYGPPLSEALQVHVSYAVPGNQGHFLEPDSDVDYSNDDEGESHEEESKRDDGVVNLWLSDAAFSAVRSLLYDLKQYTKQQSILFQDEQPDPEWEQQLKLLHRIFQVSYATFLRSLRASLRQYGFIVGADGSVIMPRAVALLNLGAIMSDVTVIDGYSNDVKQSASGWTTTTQ